jgi:hypothetical protein
LAARYDWELDLSLAAAEAGVPRGKLEKALGQTGELARVLGQLDGGTVKREVLAAHFATLIREMEQGKVLRRAPPAGPGPPPEDTDVIVNSVGMKLKRLQAGSFQMGSPPDEPGRDEEKSRTPSRSAARSPSASSR